MSNPHMTKLYLLVLEFGTVLLIKMFVLNNQQISFSFHLVLNDSSNLMEYQNANNKKALQ